MKEINHFGIIPGDKKSWTHQHKKIRIIPEDTKSLNQMKNFRITSEDIKILERNKIFPKYYLLLLILIKCYYLLTYLLAYLLTFLRTYLLTCLLTEVTNPVCQDMSNHIIYSLFINRFSIESIFTVYETDRTKVSLQKCSANFWLTSLLHGGSLKILLKSL